ncbi:hypothetical protein, partial [Streptomyces albidoflavus]|uniref:hypothetical protein n=1 Tax=Streptomyces albidoflavus TaxID=1886 RepID=UPI0034A15CB9
MAVGAAQVFEPPRAAPDQVAAIPLGGYIRMIGMFPPGADGRIEARRRVSPVVVSKELGEGVTGGRPSPTPSAGSHRLARAGAARWPGAGP